MAEIEAETEAENGLTGMVVGIENEKIEIGAGAEAEKGTGEGTETGIMIKTEIEIMAGTGTGTGTGARPVFWPCAAASLAPTAAGAGTTLTYHLITAQLALLAIIPTGVFAARRGLVEYNVVFFREGVQEICAVEADARRGA